MGKISKSVFRDWKDGDTIDAKEYKKDREVLRVAINDTHDRFLEEQSEMQQIKVQFQSVLDETTGKDVISAPEITAARVGADDTIHPNLKERLDTEYQKLSSQLASIEERKADKESVEQISSQLAHKVSQEELKGLAKQEDLETTNQNLLSTSNRLSDVMLYINGQNASNAVVNKQLEPTLVLIDDDTRNELYDLIFPVLQAKGVKLSSAAITSRIGNNPNTITLAQFREMRDSGLVEFVTHTHNHVPLDELTEEEIDYEIRTSQAWLMNEGVNSAHIVYPYGRFNETIRRVAAKYVKSGSKSNGLYFDPNNSVMDSFLIPRINFEESISTLKNRIDSIKSINGLMVVNIHSQYPEFSVSKFEELIDYAISSDVKIKTIGEAYNDFSNLLELRDHGELIMGISATGYSAGESKKHISELGPYTIDYAQSQTIRVDSPIFKLERSVIVTPNLTLPNGITYSFAVEEEGVGLLRIYNVREGEKTIDRGKWIFTTV